MQNYKIVKNIGQQQSWRIVSTMLCACCNGRKFTAEIDKMYVQLRTLKTQVMRNSSYESETQSAAPQPPSPFPPPAQEFAREREGALVLSFDLVHDLWGNIGHTC